jgi:hypothetical protein
MFGLLSRYRRYTVESFLRRRGVAFSSTPLFEGPWPHFDVRGGIILGADCFHSLDFSFSTSDRIAPTSDTACPSASAPCLGSVVTAP